MDRFTGAELPFIDFSIEADTPEVHDAIRGRGNFARMLANHRRSRELGYRSFAIVSVSRQNHDRLLGTLSLCDELGFEHINVYYVTNRGFATSEMVLSIPEWQHLYDSVRRHAEHLRIDARIERTFVPPGEDREPCAVRERSNLMFFPDRRVFMCAMFIDVPEGHSFMWRGGALVPNHARTSEGAICAKDDVIYCPAMRYVNPTIAVDAEQRGLCVGCIYDKTRMRGEILAAH